MKSLFNLFLLLSCFTIILSSCSKQEEIIQFETSSSNTEITTRSSGLATNQAITVFGNRIQHETDYSCEASDEAVCGILFDPAITDGTEVALSVNEYLTTFSVSIEDTLVYEDWDFTATFEAGMEIASTITIVEDTRLPVQICEYFSLVGIPTIKPGVYEIYPNDQDQPTMHFDLDYEAYLPPPFPPLLTITQTDLIWDYEIGEIVGSSICWKYTPFLLDADGTNSTPPWNSEFTVTIKELPNCMSGPWTYWSQGDLKNFMNDEDLPLTDQITQTFNYDHESESWCFNYYFDEPYSGEKCYVVQITYPDGSSTYALIKRG